METMEAHNQAVPTTTLTEETTEATTLSVTHGGDHGDGDHKASTLTATTFLTASIEMEAHQRNARWTA